MPPKPKPTKKALNKRRKEAERAEKASTAGFSQLKPRLFCLGLEKCSTGMDSFLTGWVYRHDAFKAKSGGSQFIPEGQRDPVYHSVFDAAFGVQSEESSDALTLVKALNYRSYPNLPATCDLESAAEDWAKTTNSWRQWPYGDLKIRSVGKTTTSTGGRGDKLQVQISVDPTEKSLETAAEGPSMTQEETPSGLTQGEATSGCTEQMQRE
jgi:hypothetical protein